MRRIIQMPAIFMLLLVATLTGCNDHGSKIKVEGTKGEIYYKDGATESQAEKVGSYLKQVGFIGNEKKASIQVAKENGEYTIRFVYDKDFYEKNKNFKEVFKQMGSKLSEDIFDGEKVNIALADNKFKDYEIIRYYKTAAKKEESENSGVAPAEPGDQDGFDRDTQGGITFYWKGLSDNESKVIADYIVKEGDFAGGSAELYMIKDDNHYTFKFPVKENYRSDQATIDELGKVSAKIKDNLFPYNSFTFEMTDEKLVAVKSFNY